MDLRACVDKPVILKPMERKIIPCGFKMALPMGYEAQIRPRSGLALKHGLELSVTLINLGDKDFYVNRGDRIAQMIINKVEMIEFTETDDLPESERGDSGFGSTGR
jgi:dUTP pyrophosphatase